MPVVPLGDRKLRACLATGLIKTEEQWFKDGCAAAREKIARRPPAAHRSRPRPRKFARPPAARPPLTPAAPHRSHDIFGYIRMAEDRDVVHEFTSPNFDGMVAIMEPKNSWVARWQGVQNFVPGCYALRVRGTLPSQWATLLEDEGFKYEPLDEDAPVAPPETI